MTSTQSDRPGRRAIPPRDDTSVDRASARRERRAGDCGSGSGTRVFDDPLPALPDTARNLLLAAKHIIATEGFDALTLNAVSVASGENKAMVAYYFGNKAGLVGAVLDSVIHDEYVASLERMSRLDPAQRARQLVEEMGRMASATEEFLVFFDMLPHVLRDDALRHRMAQLYEWYWSIKLKWLGAGEDALDRPELLGLTQLLSAVIDGLAIQAAIDPEMDLANPLRVLSTLLRDAPLLTEGLPSATGPDPRPPGPRPPA
jgi:AcrR family transcriptional regulator